MNLIKKMIILKMYPHVSSNNSHSQKPLHLQKHKILMK